MKKLFFLAIGLAIAVLCNSQNYNNIVNYTMQGTPAYGMKIKTNIPFRAYTGMITLTILGYDFANTDEDGGALGLTIVWYVGGRDIFERYSVSSFGSRTPNVYLAKENGNVVVFLDEKVYFQRFTVSAYATGQQGETPAMFAGWTAVDEAVGNTNKVLLPYKNKFGFLRAAEIKVLPQTADFVFEPDYDLRPLEQVETFIKENKHLPEIPSAAQMEEDGINVAEMNRLLLQKIEELTLYVIEQQKQIEALNSKIENIK